MEVISGIAILQEKRGDPVGQDHSRFYDLAEQDSV